MSGKEFLKDTDLEYLDENTPLLNRLKLMWELKKLTSQEINIFEKNGIHLESGNENKYYCATVKRTGKKHSVQIPSEYYEKFTGDIDFRSITSLESHFQREPEKRFCPKWLAHFLSGNKKGAKPKEKKTCLIPKTCVIMTKPIDTQKIYTNLPRIFTEKGKNGPLYRNSNGIEQSNPKKRKKREKTEEKELDSILKKSLPDYFIKEINLDLNNQKSYHIYEFQKKKE